MSYMYKKHGAWRLTVYNNGHKKDITLGKDLNHAKIIKASLEQANQDSRFKKSLVDTLAILGFIDTNCQPVSDDKNITWAYAKQKLIDHLQHMGKAPNTIKGYGYAFSSLERVLKPEKPSDITTEKVDSWIETLLNTKIKKGNKLTNMSNGGINAYIRSAKAAFQKFLRWRFVSVNPFKNCEAPKVELSIPRPMSPEELEKILNGSNDPLKRAIKIMVYSGMRPDEFFNLTWHRVILDQENSYIHITKDKDWIPKAHTQRMIPITKELREALGNPGKPNELICGKNEKKYTLNEYWLGRMFKRALKRANLLGKKITPYCCRDTYATNLALQGFEAHVIAARLGHRDIDTSMRYVSLASISSAGMKVKPFKA